MINWQSKLIKLENLEQFQNNPRKISESKLESLKKSLDELGTFRPFILSHDQKTILGGNQRSKILLENFPSNHEVLCMIPDRELSQEEIEKVIVLDNGHHGEWDYEILADFSIDIDELDIDVKIPELEIDVEDIDDNEKEDKDKKFLVEVQLPNEMDQADLYDDLISKGYMVKKK